MYISADPPGVERVRTSSLIRGETSPLPLSVGSPTDAYPYLATLNRA